MQLWNIAVGFIATFALTAPAIAGEAALYEIADRAFVLAQAETDARAETVEGVGVVIAADPDTTQFGSATITVDHEEIPGFMGPMEMMYSVSSPDLLEGIEPGDRVAFTIDTLSMVIDKIEALEE